MTAADLRRRPFVLTVDKQEIGAQALIIATGATAKLLGLESEKRLMGYGVSACATCDGFFFKDKDALVVGGGDTAMEEAYVPDQVLQPRCRSCIGATTLRASKIMQDRACNNPKIAFIWDSTIEEINGKPDKTGVTGARLRNLKTGATSEVQAPTRYSWRSGISPTPACSTANLRWTNWAISRSGRGSTYTNVEGVFAAGDVADRVYRQAVTAAGTGCMAAIDAERWLEAHEAH